MNKDYPGTVFIRENATGQEVAVNNLKAFATVDHIDLPSVIPLSVFDAHSL